MYKEIDDYIKEIQTRCPNYNTSFFKDEAFVNDFRNAFSSLLAAQSYICIEYEDIFSENITIPSLPLSNFLMYYGKIYDVVLCKFDRVCHIKQDEHDILYTIIDEMTTNIVGHLMLPYRNKNITVAQQMDMIEFSVLNYSNSYNHFAGSLQKTNSNFDYYACQKLICIIATSLTILETNKLILSESPNYSNSIIKIENTINEMNAILSKLTSALPGLLFNK